MKITLLKDKDMGLARPRLAGSELDIDPDTGNEWIAAGDARPSITELMAQAAAAPKRTIISKPAEHSEGENATAAKAKS